MKKYVEISVVFDRDSRLARRLKSIFPLETSRVTLGVSLEVDDARLKEVTDVLADEGRYPYGENVPFEMGVTYSRRNTYEYEDDDYARADYFLHTAHEMLWTKRLEGGLWGVQVNYADSGLPSCPKAGLVAHYQGWGRAVSPAFRKEIETRGLVGPAFQEMVPYLDKTPGASIPYSEITWDQSDHGPWFDMDCEVVLPPVHPSVRVLRLHKWETVPRGESKVPVTRKDGVYPYPEIHYLKDEISQIEPFDMARTLERFHPMPEVASRGGQLIFSRRFYDLCNEWGLGGGWTPVYVHD